jgi:hypothetical protein
METDPCGSRLGCHRQQVAPQDWRKGYLMPGRTFVPSF